MSSRNRSPLSLSLFRSFPFSLVLDSNNLEIWKSWRVKGTRSSLRFWEISGHIYFFFSLPFERVRAQITREREGTKGRGEQGLVFSVTRGRNVALALF